MKLIVKTTGDFLLVDPVNMQEIYTDRPTIVSNTNFIGSRIAHGQLTVLAEVPIEATDNEFASYWAECNQDADFAIQSYKSKFEPTPSPGPKLAPHPTPTITQAKRPVAAPPKLEVRK